MFFPEKTEKFSKLSYLIMEAFLPYLVVLFLVPVVSS